MTDEDDRVSIPLPFEDAVRGLLGVDPDEVRWYIVEAATGRVELPPNPQEGFVTEDEAHEFHQTVLKGDQRLEVRSQRTP